MILSFTAAPTPPLGIDYAWSHPNPAAIAQAGYSFVIRYLSHDPTKDLTPVERDSLFAAHLGILLVAETTAQRALAGASAGHDDAQEFRGRASAIGYPTTYPVFFADDTDTTLAQVSPYFEAAAAADRNAGAYGPDRVVDPLVSQGVLPWGWQTCAWPTLDAKGNELISQVAHLYQRLRPTRSLVTPAPFDEDVQLRPLPIWGQSDPTVTTVPTVTATPIKNNATGTDSMYIFRVTDGPHANDEIFNYGYGPVHIGALESAELVRGGVPVVPISGAVYDARFAGRVG